MTEQEDGDVPYVISYVIIISLSEYPESVFSQSPGSLLSLKRRFFRTPVCLGFKVPCWEDQTAPLQFPPQLAEQHSSIRRQHAKLSLMTEELQKVPTAGK